MKKKVAIVGPESTGKTTLAMDLADRFQDEWVPEYSREFLSNLGRPYVQDDLIEIARGQLALEEKIFSICKNLLICDTNLVVIWIWSQFKYGQVHQDIIDLYESSIYDHYLLTAADITYEDDPLRENPQQRAELFEIYQSHLDARGLPYTIVAGDQTKRLKTATLAITNLLEKS